jgi:hypothetical protein
MRRLTVVGVCVGSFVLAGVTMSGQASGSPATVVSFRHRSTSMAKPYQLKTTKPDAIIEQGHGGHAGPVFPDETASGEWGRHHPAVRLLRVIDPGDQIVVLGMLTTDEELRLEASSTRPRWPAPAAAAVNSSRSDLSPCWLASVRLACRGERSRST